MKKTNPQTRKVADAVRQAAQACSDLTAFHLVLTIMESGSINTPSHKYAQEIARICKRVAHDRLLDYDHHMAVAKTVVSP